MISSFADLKDLRILLDQKQSDKNIICSLANRAGKILYVSESFCNISGYEPSELIGSDHNIVNSGLHKGDFFRNMWRSIACGKVWQGEIRNQAKCGEFYWVDTIIFPVFNSIMQQMQYFSVRTLINDKKKLEAEKDHLIEQLKMVLFKISHEIRLLVTQIMAMSSLLSEAKDMSRGEITEILHYTVSSAEALDRHTRELSRLVERLSQRQA